MGYGKFGFGKFGVFFKNRNSDSKISESINMPVGNFGVNSLKFGWKLINMPDFRTDFH